MKIFCLSDPHLSYGTNKPMDIYGSQWLNHGDKIKKNWLETVGNDDIVIVPGDISWAKNAQEVAPDMDFFKALPGKIIFGKGNHENWWQSHNKTLAMIPENSCLLDASHPFIDENMNLAIVGTRLWDNPQLRFSPWIQFQPNTSEKDLVTESNEQTEKIFNREFGRLQRALEELGDATIRIAALHYPPTTPDFVETEVTELLEKYQVQHCVFGHIHSLKPEVDFSGELNNIKYSLCAVDHIDFCPKLIVEI